LPLLLRGRTHQHSMAAPSVAAAAAAAGGGDGSSSSASAVDQALNPLVAGLKASKTMALTDMARAMKEAGVDVRMPLWWWFGLRLFGWRGRV
jgi:hypothetical protein